MNDTSPTEAVLLDTDVFSYLGKEGDARANIYKPHVEGKLLAVSFITVGEMLFGAANRKWGRVKVEALKARLRTVTIVPYDWEVCQTYGELKEKLIKAGRPVDDNDLWIAACAVRHSIPLISNNRKHFEHVPGLHLISEAPVIAEIQSQTELSFPSGSTGNEPPSSQ